MSWSQRTECRPHNTARPPASFCSLHRATVVRLDTIFRQAEGSFIVTNAHRINRGQMPILDNGKTVDFFLFRTDDPERARSCVWSWYKTRIPRRFGIPATERSRCSVPCTAGWSVLAHSTARCRLR